MTNKPRQSDLLVLTVLVLLGTIVRVALRDLPNFAPVAALALFAGYYAGSVRRAVWVPLAVMALSDAVIRGYPREFRGACLMLAVYLALALPVLFGPWLRRRVSLVQGSRFGAWCRLLGASLLGSLAFFVLSNFATWLWFEMYPHTAAGLMTCYVQAIPFFRATLAGDFVFGAGLFGSYALSQALSRKTVPANC